MVLLCVLILLSCPLWSGSGLGGGGRIGAEHACWKKVRDGTGHKRGQADGRDNASDAVDENNTDEKEVASQAYRTGVGAKMGFKGPRVKGGMHGETKALLC